MLMSVIRQRRSRYLEERSTEGGREGRRGGGESLMSKRRGEKEEKYNFYKNTLEIAIIIIIIIITRKKYKYKKNGALHAPSDRIRIRIPLVDDSQWRWTI